MKKVSSTHRFSVTKRLIQRAALFFVIIALVFGLIEPGVSTLFALSGQKEFDTRYKIDPLKSEKQQNIIPITQTNVGNTDLEVKPDKTRVREDISKRTAFTSSYINKDGTKTLEYSPQQQNYKDGERWQKIDNTLSDNGQSAPAPNLWQSITNSAPKAQRPTKFSGKSGSIDAQMGSLSEGISFTANGKKITMIPQGARDILPERKDDTTVIYKNAYPNVDIEYQLRGESVKEIIVLKNNQVKTEFDFTVLGGKVVDHPTLRNQLTIEGMPAEFSFSKLTLDVHERGVISEQRVTQSASAKGIRISVDERWLKSQRSSAFPMYIDPSFSRDSTSYWMFKSDGYSCGANICYGNIGAIYDNGWKNWRTYVQFPYGELAGKKVLDASMHGFFQYGKNGITDPRWIAMGHANCIGYWCQGTQVASAPFGTDFDLNFTGELQNAVNNGDYGAVWSFWSEEGAYKSFKPYYNLRAWVVYDTPTPIANPISPANGQVLVDTQPTVKVNPVSDADGDAVQYYFRVSTNSNAETGAVINSGWVNSPQWTVPDGILQDGTTYYWHAYTKGATQTNPNWVSSFKVNLRTGKDSTQSYDTVGPVGVDLATGNATLSATTHTMKSLGGDIGLHLSYNTPNRAKKGLLGEYWNVSSGYNFANGVPKDVLGKESAPASRHRDQNIDFDWVSGSPDNAVQNDWFYGRWTGQFIAPVTGEYQFGGKNDDNFRVWVRDTQVLNNAYTANTIQYGTPITLQAGQAVSLRAEYLEATWGAYAHLYVKGAVAEQIVPADWLYTNLSNQSQSYGLNGRYYTDNSNAHDLDAATSDPSRLLLSRQDTTMNLNFGVGAPAQGLQSDNFMARWTGYITVPKAGSYTLGANSDDGIRIKVHPSSWQTVLDRWNYQAGTTWGTAVSLPANTPIPIQIDWFELSGPASINLRVQGNGFSDQDIPVTWLTPGANALPEQWRLGVNVDGAVSYERLRISNNSVILEDASGSTHEYIYTNGSYKPPVNEDGNLVKNADNSYTLIDTDGRTYIFDPAGKLISLTSPSDDRQPAALKYTYAGDPSRLIKVEDGVTRARYATIFYKGINETDNICDKNGTNNPSGIFGLAPSFADPPTGMLCALKSTEGDITNFYYDSYGNLGRIVQPGGVITDYAYDAIGRVVAVRDSNAADAIAAGVRAADTTVTTELTYDSLGRITTVKAPAATTNAVRLTHTLSFSPGQTDMHVTGATEPNGFSRRVRYDNLLRTIQETDLTGKTTSTEWDTVKDLQLSSTDATGLKSTTIYDADDRPIDSYGPAPAEWYETTGVNVRRPLAAYTNQVPHTSTGYDENIKGFAASWFNLKSANMTMFGAPKYVHLGYANPSDMVDSGAGSTRFDYRNSALPITPDTTIPGVDGYGIRATAKMTFPANGTYTFWAYADDSFRLSIDDQQLFSNWGTKTEGATQNRLTGTFNATAGKSYRVMIEYGHTGVAGAFDVWLAGPGVIDASGGQGLGVRNWTPYVSPGYNLTTSTKAYDKQLGDIETKTVYKDPAYGQIEKTVLDQSGLNYEAKATYEEPGVGFLRQTSKTLPGGAKTTYQHYGADETRANPCIPSDTTTYHQAGKPKGKIEPDPDGDGPQTGRSSETIYNESGDVIATRYNTDPWTCTSYDSRGRVTTTTVPVIDGRPGRTITNNYAVGGNPLITSTTDASGTITVENDLLGRTLKYTDAKGNSTTNTYDDYGKLTKRESKVGTETYDYDQYDRLIKQKLDNVTFATVTYDEYSRIQRVDYPAGMSLEPAVRDQLGRVSKVTYKVGDQFITDEITRSVSGMVLSGNENGVAKSYTYDKAARLTSAKIGDNTFGYGFGVFDASCAALPGNNPNAAKDSNRMSYTLNGQTTTYCYDMADRLIASSDPRFSTITYDAHGNITRLGDDTHKTQFIYDAIDRNIGISETTATSSRNTTYERDTAGRISKRTYTVDGQTKDESYYGFNGPGDSPAFLTNTTGQVTQKYLSLAGGIRVTLKPQSTSAGATTYSLTNTHGDTMATVDADGKLTIIAPTGPFGEQLPNRTSPTNSATGTSNDYLGGHAKSTETDYLLRPTQMGARVYLADLGRFLQVDPVEGGTPNNYVYPADPVNQRDVNGKFTFLFAAIQRIVSIVTMFVDSYMSQPVRRSSNAQSYPAPAPPTAILMSKNNSQSGKGYQQPSGREWDAAARKKAGDSSYNKKDYLSYKDKKNGNEKFEKCRNGQKRGGFDGCDPNNPTGEENEARELQYRQAEVNNNAAAVASASVGVGVLIWWGLKVLSPACGPLAPACAVVL